MTDADPAPQPAAQPSRHPQQNLILVIAGVLIAAVVVLVLVVSLGGSDGPAAGSPDAVTDQFAAALGSHEAARVAEVSCRSARHRVAEATRGVLADNTSAQRKGSADVRDSNAVGQVALDVDQHYLLPGPSGAQTSSSSAKVVATVALHQDAGTWCVDGFAVALPTH